MKARLWNNKDIPTTRQESWKPDFETIKKLLQPDKKAENQFPKQDQQLRLI